MLINAKFSSYCAACRREIHVGDRIDYVRGERPKHAQCSERGQAMQARIEESRATEAPLEFDASKLAPEGLELLDYQKAGVHFALNHRSVLIADEMGLGKTVQGIALINVATDVRRVLIVCPKSLKLNWRNELSKWLVHRLSVGMYPVCRDITIAHYEQLKKIDDWKTEDFDLLIVDEAHYAKNEKAQRTKHLKRIAKRAHRKVFLTGTPILNRPLELWSLLQMLAPEYWDPAGKNRGKLVGAGEGAGFFRYVKRFCDAKEVWIRNKKFWDFTGASNLEELQDRLRSTVMIRRLKSEVLTELPEKRRMTIALDGCEPDDDEEDFDPEYYGSDEVKRGPKFEEMSAARHKTALAKVPAAVEYIENALESSQKMVVFCHHQDVALALYEGLKGFGALEPITGLTSVEERQARVESFQQDSEARVIIGTIGAMGVGHTLTAASHVVFVELSWVPAELSQAEDRLHRIGQVNAVLVEHLVTPGSIDEQMIEKILVKQQVADLALDEERNLTVDLSERKEFVPRDSVELVRESAVLAKLRFLSARCDGAQAQDGMGFNGVDSNFGKELAQRSALTSKMVAAAEKLLVKYQRQLSQGGFQ